MAYTPYYDDRQRPAQEMWAFFGPPTRIPPRNLTVEERRQWEFEEMVQRWEDYGRQHAPGNQEYANWFRKPTTEDPYKLGRQTNDVGPQPNYKTIDPKLFGEGPASGVIAGKIKALYAQAPITPSYQQQLSAGGNQGGASAGTQAGTEMVGAVGVTAAKIIKNLPKDMYNALFPQGRKPIKAGEIAKGAVAGFGNLAKAAVHKIASIRASAKVKTDDFKTRMGGPRS